MITAKAVFEVEPLDASTAPAWPVAADGPWSWVALDAHCTDEQVGLFVAVLASRIEVPLSDGAAQAAEALVAEEVLLINGGLRLHDSATATIVVPGCCAGLENWRDWADVLSGDPIWLGHAPEPQIEMIGENLRLWQDGRHRDDSAGSHIDIPRAALPTMLLDVQNDLLGFLKALTGWADRVGLGQRALSLVEAIDESFKITSPGPTTTSTTSCLPT
ncbi:hypothetical protein ACQPZJ_27385 [Actinoplanes sp. CA-054009]